MKTCMTCLNKLWCINHYKCTKTGYIIDHNNISIGRFCMQWEEDDNDKRKRKNSSKKMA